MPSRNRLLDLLVARATEGLPADESAELERALTGRRDAHPDDIDLAAAAVYLAFDAASSRSETMPETLKRRILADWRSR